VGKQDRQGRQAGLGRKDWDGCGQETVRDPVLDLCPMDFHLGEKALRGNKKFCAIGEHSQEKGEGKVVPEMGGDPRTMGGEASNCGKGRLRKGKTAGEVGGGGEVGEEPVTVVSKLRGRVQKLAIKSYQRRPAGS